MKILPGRVTDNREHKSPAVERICTLSVCRRGGRGGQRGAWPCRSNTTWEQSGKRGIGGGERDEHVELEIYRGHLSADDE